MLGLAMPSAHAQLAHQLFEIVITKHGESCTGIAKAQAIGTSTEGDSLVAVVCSNGGNHVVRLHKNNAVSYLSSCATLASETGLRCFAPR